MPRSSTPADPRPQALTGPAMWSSAKLTTSTPHGTLSRLNHAACTLSVYASQPGSPPDHATLDSGWWPALTGQGFHLLGRVEGFRHVYPSTWLSPSPSFAWRNNPQFLRRPRRPSGRGYTKVFVDVSAQFSSRQTQANSLPPVHPLALCAPSTDQGKSCCPARAAYSRRALAVSGFLRSMPRTALNP